MIKTLIFDFGDVFINLDKQATLRELQKLNISQFTDELIEKNKVYEMGLISSEAFLTAYIDQFSHLNSDLIRNSWNAILMDFPIYRFQFIKKLSEEKDYKLILLSNTNEMHINWIKQDVFFFEDFKNCFDSFYLSHEIKLRKPNADIFQYVLEKENLIAEECLFIDDTLENTEAAAKLGLKTWHLEPTREDVIDLFTTKKELF
mgnify:FL=1|tara:strand:+ start:22348 stop:22956 length:609 start_codon:yes stop_codon:yes gene_type:complete